MLRCDLFRILKEISPRFEFYYKVDKYSHSSLWFHASCHCPDCKEQGHFLVCAIPDDYVPEYTLIQADEFIRFRGWREIFRIVMAKKHNGKRILDQDRVKRILRKHGYWNFRPYTIKETSLRLQDGTQYV